MPGGARPDAGVVVRWVEGLTVLYVVAMAGGTGCGAVLRAARLRHAESAPVLPPHPEQGP
ncbi:MAG: hypothetical protein JWN17_2919 [Frankiales bacterium]|nr:hypothetical protein [Frankiales bacterium]